MRMLQIYLAISTQNQTRHCRLSASPGAVLVASFICSLNMREEGLEKEENGCLKCKCSPQAADSTWPQTVKVLEATPYAQNRGKGELLNQLSTLCYAQIGRVISFSVWLHLGALIWICLMGTKLLLGQRTSVPFTTLIEWYCSLHGQRKPSPYS